MDVSASYQLLIRQKSSVKSLSLDLGMIGKTAGFLPEETALGGHVGFRFGLSLLIV